MKDLFCLFQQLPLLHGSVFREVENCFCSSGKDYAGGRVTFLLWDTKGFFNLSVFGVRLCCQFTSPPLFPLSSVGIKGTSEKNCPPSLGLPVFSRPG